MPSQFKRAVSPASSIGGDSTQAILETDKVEEVVQATKVAKSAARLFGNAEPATSETEDIDEFMDGQEGGDMRDGYGVKDVFLV